MKRGNIWSRLLPLRWTMHFLPSFMVGTQLSGWMAYVWKQRITSERQFASIVIPFHSSTAFAVHQIIPKQSINLLKLHITSFISFWPHQQEPLYKDFNLWELKMTDWFTNTGWQGGLATLSSVPWETPVSLCTPGHCFTPFYHSLDYRFWQL